ncbi:MAG TPA: nitroreductase family protein [Candidatus Acidoferrum sp.]|nr:nitroreductase family protein [Candidatus Acidoferrum sp.]
MWVLVYYLVCLRIVAGIMEFEQVIKKRRMIREFDPDKQIAEKIITKLIRNAHRAPSAGHTQVQEFIIIRDRAIKKRLRRAAVNQEYVEDAPILIVVCSNTSRSEQRYGRRGREFYSIIDGAFASMLILLTAVNERIGAGFVGAFDDGKVSEILKLPRYVRPIGIIILGYPKETEPFERFERIAIEDLIHYEKW